jgi:hypothetical protein
MVTRMRIGGLVPGMQVPPHRISGTRIFHEIPERSVIIVYPALPFFGKKI